MRGLCVVRRLGIFQVANALDAATASRFPPESAVEVARDRINKLSGKQFAAEIVKAFLTLPVKTLADLRREIDASISE